jgi:hypothetical protein
MAPQFPHLHSTVGLSASSTGGALGSASMTSGAGTILNVFCRRAGIARTSSVPNSELNKTSFGQLPIKPATRFQRTSSAMRVGSGFRHSWPQSNVAKNMTGNKGIGRRLSPRFTGSSLGAPPNWVRRCDLVRFPNSPALTPLSAASAKCKPLSCPGSCRRSWSCRQESSCTMMRLRWI